MTSHRPSRRRAIAAPHALLALALNFTAAQHAPSAQSLDLPEGAHSVAQPALLPSRRHLLATPDDRWQGPQQSEGLAHARTSSSVRDLDTMERVCLCYLLRCVRD